MSNLNQDLRFALRKLRKNPAFSAVSILTLALAMGATTAIFSVVYGVLLRPLPYDDPNRIMAIHEVNPQRHVVAAGGSEFRRLSRPESQLSGNCEIHRRHFRIRRLAANAYDGSERVVRFLQGLPCATYHRTRSNCRGRAQGRCAGRSGQLRILEAVSRISTDLSQLHLKIDNTVFSVIGVLPDGFQFPAGGGDLGCPQILRAKIRAEPLTTTAALGACAMG